jgi:hypothetical protein
MMETNKQDVGNERDLCVSPYIIIDTAFYWN